MSEQWLADVRAAAAQVAALDARQALSDLERVAISEAGIILRLVDEVERLKQDTPAQH